jgi:transposase
MDPRTPLRPISSNNQRNHEYSPRRRAQIYGAARCGATPAQIARSNNLHPETVRATIQRIATTGSIKSAPRSGRPEVYSHYDERQILRIVRKNPKITYKDLRRETGLSFSDDTFYRILKDHGITNWICKKRPYLSEEHAKLRLAFAKKYLHLTVEEWFRYIFSDECSVERSKGKKREWCFRTPDQKWDKSMIQTYNKGKGVSVIVWAAISRSFERSELVVMERDPFVTRKGYSAVSYCDALEMGLIPVLEDDYIFIQDNAPIHKSRYAMEWFEKVGVTLLLDWSPYSPDLNPIEHIWFRLKEAVYQINPRFDEIQGDDNIREALKEVLPEAWRAILSEVVRGVLQSMPARMKAVVDVEGWHTKY